MVLFKVFSIVTSMLIVNDCWCLKILSKRINIHRSDIKSLFVVPICDIFHNLLILTNIRFSKCVTLRADLYQQPNSKRQFRSIWVLSQEDVIVMSSSLMKVFDLSAIILWKNLNQSKSKPWPMNWPSNCRKDFDWLTF